MSILRKTTPDSIKLRKGSMWFRMQVEPDTEFWQNLIYCHTVKFILAAVILIALHEKFDTKDKRKRNRSRPAEFRPITEKNNPHPFLLPDVLIEILSHVDVLSLYKCRRVNSEWADIVAREIKKRLPTFESEVKAWEDIQYRPSDEEILATISNEEGAHNYRTYFGGRSVFFRNYIEQYPALYHIQDLVVAQDLGKKLLDLRAPFHLPRIYKERELASPNFPFLLKLEFKYENYQLNFKYTQGLEWNIKLTAETLPKSLTKFCGCEYEGLFDVVNGKSYNIRLLKEPKLALGILPIDEDGKNFLPFVFGASAFIADNWTIFPHVFDVFLVLFSGYAIAHILKREYEKISALVVLEILILVFFNFPLLFDILRLFVIVCFGYNILSFLNRARQALPTTESGKVIIGIVLVLDLIYMNVNLKLFVTNVNNGNILWTLLYYSIVFGVGAMHVIACKRMYPRGQLQQQVNKGFWIRVIIMTLVYVFYNPE